MPTYIVSAATGRLSADAKQRIAEEITRIHNQATGAQSFADRQRQLQQHQFVIHQPPPGRLRL